MYVFSAKGAAFTWKPGAVPQDYGNSQTPALKARFTSAVSSMQQYYELARKPSASIFDKHSAWD
jgi:hypothetical protein